MFLVNERFQVEEGLARGFFLANSEVGDRALTVTRFLYRHVCGNHIVWDAEDVQQTRIVHMGKTAREWRVETSELNRWAASSAADDRARIEKARAVVFGKSKDEVLDAVFGLKSVGLSRTMIGHAYETAEQFTDSGDPRTAWGLAQGLTRYSQQRPYANERAALDKAAGRLLRVAF